MNELPPLQITLQLAGLASFLGVAFKGLQVALSTRDSIRDTSAAVKQIAEALGKEDPPSGALGKIRELRLEQAQHREWLVRAGFDRRRRGLAERRSGGE